MKAGYLELTMLDYLTAYIVTALTFLILDALWLSRIAKSFYFSQLGHLLRQRPRLGIAALFYAVYVVGIVIFAIAPALNSGLPGQAFLNGALFGFFAYATYDITNYATLKNWPVPVTVVDIAWGTLLTGVSAYIGAITTPPVLAAL